MKVHQRLCERLSLLRHKVFRLSSFKTSRRYGPVRTFATRASSHAVVSNDAHGSMAVVTSAEGVVGDNKDMRTLWAMAGWETPSSEKEIVDLSGDDTDCTAAPNRTRTTQE